MSSFRNLIENVLIEYLTNKELNHLTKFSNTKKKPTIGNLFQIETTLYNLNKSAKELRDLKYIISQNLDLSSEDAKLLKKILLKYNITDNDKNKIIEVLEKEKENLYDLKNNILLKVPNEYITEYSYFPNEDTLRPLFKLWNLTFHGNPIDLNKIKEIPFNIPIYVIYNKIGKHKTPQIDQTKELFDIFNNIDEYTGYESMLTETQTAAIKHQLAYLSNKSPDLLIKVLSKFPYLISYVSSNYDTFKTIIGKNSSALQYIPKEFKDQEIYLNYIKNNNSRLSEIPEELWNNEEFCIKAATIANEKLPGVLTLINKDIKENVFKKLLEQDISRYFRYTPDKFKSYELCVNAVKQKPKNIKFVPKQYQDQIKQELGIH